MEQEGKIIKCLPARSGESERGLWVSQEYVLEVTHRNDFKTRMCFTVFGAENIRRFAIREGMLCSVFFSIDAREKDGKWYNSIKAYDVREKVMPAPAGTPFD